MTISAAIPEESRESVLIEDLLCCLGGFQGKYITAQPIRSPYEARSFVVSDSVGNIEVLVFQLILLITVAFKLQIEPGTTNRDQWKGKQWRTIKEQDV